MNGGNVLMLKTVCQVQARRKKRIRSYGDSSSSNRALLMGTNNTKGTQSCKTRHRTWKSVQRQKYTLYKKGNVVREHDIARMHTQGTLTHDYLWYFVHTDDKIERADRIEPKWVVVMRTETGTYLHPQQPYLTRIYKQLNRCNYRLAFTMMDDGTPYWVDTHIARIYRDKEAKKRYSEKTRKSKRLM